MAGDFGGLKIIGLALLVVAALVGLALALRRRLPAAQQGVGLMTLRSVVSGMEIAASAFVAGATAECLGDYQRDPRRLVVQVLTRTEADSQRLIAEADLGHRLRELLTAGGYPAAAIAEVGLSIRSREALRDEGFDDPADRFIDPDFNPDS
jgi:hypothetical protein